MSSRSSRSGPSGRSGRELMLEQIRKALGRSTSPLGQSAAADPASDALRRLDHLGPLGEVMPAIPPDQLIPRLEEELGKVAVQTHRASSLAELEKILADIFTSTNATSAVLSRNPLLARLGIESRLGASGKSVAVWAAPTSSPDFPTDPGSRAGHDAEEVFRQRCFSAEIGITGVDFALSESGTLVVTSLTEGSQLASLAPPVHVALYRREQVMATLEEVLDRLLGLPLSGDPAASNKLNWGRSVVFITGTSRTADIEQILIRGVHGPREVRAILVEEACLRDSELEA
ncbi:MAG: LutC/YkgG family protein [Terriglobia bacterium]